MVVALKTTRTELLRKYAPTWQSWYKKGNLLSQCQLGSWAGRFSIRWTGLTLFSRKLLRPPKHGKLGEFSTLQITRSEDCRSICYKSSSLGNSRKHNFHKTLLNEENQPGLFFARCCTPPGALCHLSCFGSKWNGVSQRDSNGYFSKKEKLKFTMEILCLPWPFQQLTGTQRNQPAARTGSFLQICEEFHLSSYKLKRTPPSPQLVTCSFSIAYSTLLFLANQETYGLKPLWRLAWAAAEMADAWRAGNISWVATLEELVPENMRGKGSRRRITRLRTILFVASICLANWQLRSMARIFPTNLSELAVGFHSSNCSHGY